MSYTFYKDGHEFETTQEPAEYNDHYLYISENGKRAVLGYTSPDNCDPLNPRREYDNLGTMACFHRKHYLGDTHNYDMEAVQDIEKNTKDYISLPLYLYDHSGLTMNTTGFSCPWDSGRLGLIFVSKEKVRKEYGWANITKSRKKKILSYLEGEVETYDQYLTGDVYGVCYDTYINVAEEGDDPEWEEDSNDSCWGFFGSKYAEGEVLAGMKYWKEEIEKPLPLAQDPDQLNFEWKEAA